MGESWLKRIDVRPKGEGTTPEELAYQGLRFGVALVSWNGVLPLALAPRSILCVRSEWLVRLSRLEAVGDCSWKSKGLVPGSALIVGSL